MTIDRPANVPFATPAALAPAAAPARVCRLVAVGRAPERLPDGRAWDAEAVAGALERLAAELEGEGDQALLIRGDGPDGAIEASFLPTDGEGGQSPTGSAAVVSLASRRAQRAGRTVASKPGRRLILTVEVEGEDGPARGAALLLADEIGAWLLLEGVTMAWSTAVPVPGGGGVRAA